jgi:hypothetical protein
MADESEIDRLDPVGTTVMLTTGLSVSVVRMQTRQLFRLMRILTRGATVESIAALNFKPDASEEEKKVFSAQLLGIVVRAVPEAENETISFLQAMAEPSELIKRQGLARSLTKQESEFNAELFRRFGVDLYNPDIEDTLSLLETILSQEAPDIQALGKKLSRLWTVVRKATGSELPSPPPEGADLHLPEPTLISSI